MDSASAMRFMGEAIQLAGEAAQGDRGGPFGAVVVKDGQIIGRGVNEVLAAEDPTAHAEILAIREACRRVGSFRLEGCQLFASCEPCPMCRGAILWARIDGVYFAATRDDAAGIGFDDARFHQELTQPAGARPAPAPVLRDEARAVMAAWAARRDRRLY